MQNTKNLFIIFLSLWVLSACNCHSGNSQTNFDTQMVIDTQTMKCHQILDSLKLKYPIDSILNIVNKKGNIWIKSWKKVSKNFGVQDFQYDSDGCLQNVFSYDIEPDRDYLKHLSQCRDLFCFSDDKSKYVDMYSYRISLEKENDTIFARFDVDTKIFIVENNHYIELFTSGTIETYNDCIWIDDDYFVLLGSRSEFQDKEYFRPFIFVYNISNNYYWNYINKLTFDKKNEQFFKDKFPKIEIR